VATAAKRRKEQEELQAKGVREQAKEEQVRLEQNKLEMKYKPEERDLHMGALCT
jgi:hypothetical protein